MSTPTKTAEPGNREFLPAPFIFRGRWVGRRRKRSSPWQAERQERQFTERRKSARRASDRPGGMARSALSHARYPVGGIMVTLPGPNARDSRSEKQEVMRALQRSAYREHGRLSVHQFGSVIELRGEVTSYFIKQMAQETAKKAIGSRSLIRNLIQVQELPPREPGRSQSR